MEGVKTYQHIRKDVEAEAIDSVREMLRKAADMKDPKNMFLAVKSALDLLALLLTPGS